MSGPDATTVPRSWQGFSNIRNFSIMSSLALRVLPFQFVEQNMELAPDGGAFLEKSSGKQGGGRTAENGGAAAAAPHSCYQSNRTVSDWTRGVIVPAARVVPLAGVLAGVGVGVLRISGAPAGW